MNRILLYIAGIAVPGLWLVWAFQRPLARHFDLIWRPEIVGLWGDSFGALNALFAAGGFIAVLATLHMQSRELRRQQDQIRSADIEQQKRRFEDQFFQLLALMRQLRDEINESRYAGVSSGVIQSQRLEGLSALKIFARDMENHLERHAHPDESKEELADVYTNSVHRRSEAGLGAYFRVVYTILRRISEADVLSAGEKAQFGNLIRSQLTSHEVLLIGMNALTEQSRDFAKYVTEFRLLKYLASPNATEALKRHYPASAFEARD